MNKNWVNCLIRYKEIILLVIVAACLGFYKLGELPLPVNQDELSDIYDANSIIKTGADRFGHKLPIVLEAFGKADYRPALYTWLCTIPIKLFGSSVANARSISVICFLLSLIFLYLSCIKILDKKFALIASVIFIFSPWSWFYARIAHDGAMLPSLFVIITLYFFLRIYSDKEEGYLYFIFLGFIIGFSTNAYQSSRLIALLLAITVFAFLLFEKINRKYIKLFSFAVSCFIGALPQIYVFIYHPSYFYGRYDSVKIAAPDTFHIFYSIVQNIYINLSPDFLFFSFGKGNSLTISRFLEIESIFFYIGLTALFLINKRENKHAVLFILFLLIISIIPCALTNDNPNAIRLSCMLVICPVFIAAGFYFFIQKIKNESIQNALIAITIITIIISFNIQYNKYKHNKEVYNGNQQNNMVQIAIKLNPIYKKYDTIIFEDFGNQPYIYFLYYCNIDSKEFQSMEKIYDNRDFYSFKKMGSFYFLSYADLLKKAKESNSNNLIISYSYPHHYKIIDSIITKECIFYFSVKNNAKLLSENN